MCLGVAVGVAVGVTVGVAVGEGFGEDVGLGRSWLRRREARETREERFSLRRRQWERLQWLLWLPMEEVRLSRDRREEERPSPRDERRVE